MSSLKIEERFTVAASPERVWRFLIDPEQVVVCLPGAHLESTDDEGGYHGAIKVRVGAVTVQYKGRMVFEELDHEARFVRMAGRGKEKGGAGSVMMTMESTVREIEGGVTEVTVDSSVRLAGKIVRFGRGMIEAVSKEVFKQFTECAAAKLEASDAPDAAGPAPETEAADEPQAVAALPLLFRALRTWLRGLFGRA